MNHILTQNFLQKDIILTNGAGVHAIPISEFVLAFMLYHAKNLRKLQTLQDEHTWVRGVFLEELADATLLIIGTGNIGQAMPSLREASPTAGYANASRAKAFGVQVWGSRRHPEPLPNFDKVVGADEWRSLPP